MNHHPDRSPLADEESPVDVAELERTDPAAAFLLATCKELLHPAGQHIALAGRLTSRQWARACLLASGHRVASLCGYFALQQPSSFPENARNLLRAGFRSNRIANRVYLDELVVLVDAFAQAGVDVRVRKGAAMLQSVYRDIGVRELSDIDLLIRREDRAAAVDVMTSLGYSQGRPAPGYRTVAPLSREAQLFWGIHASSMAAFYRPAPDTVLGRLRVELRFDLLEPSAGKRLPMDEWFGAGAPGGTGPTSSPEHFFLDVAVHLFREATTLTSITMGKDLRLSWFLDIAMLVSRPSPLRPDPDALAAAVDRLDLRHEVFFALWYAHRLFPESVPRALLDRTAPAGDLGYLSEYGELDNQKSRWEAPFVDRLFDLDRDERSEGRATVIRW
ncbi:nucleotidyltransferase family protein [Streptomyces sp. NPDC021020]|uniref:nucleotidyltransferase family protein n=1 Tax=Streptomyces sp. NPDC021020 TaxID=3365109 RepID=UPI00379C009B